MYKKVILGSLVLFLAVGLVFGFGVLSSFAQEEEKEETITITTYYPSPYGVYNELQANRIAVGDTNDDGQLTAEDQPPADGQLYTARSVIYKPQSSLPAFDVREGELVYSETDKEFYYYDGSKWVKQAGAGTAVISLKCKWLCLGHWMSRILHGSDSCEPPSCPPDWTDLGTGCVCTSIAYSGSEYFNYAGYCERWCKEE